MSVTRHNVAVVVDNECVTKNSRRIADSQVEVFRSVSTWVYSGCVWAFCALCAVLAVVQEPAVTAVRILVLMATVSFLSWVVLVRPHLSVGRHHVVVSNVWRTHVIPFGAVSYVRTRGLVEIIVGSNATERTYRSWNAPGNQALRPRRGEMHAMNHPGVSHPPGTSGRRGRAGALQASSGAAQRRIEERMDDLPPGGGDVRISSSWNSHLLLPAALAVLLTVLVWIL